MNKILLFQRLIKNSKLNIKNSFSFSTLYNTLNLDIKDNKWNVEIAYLGFRLN
jgi:hypothetical protein